MSTKKSRKKAMSARSINASWNKSAERKAHDEELRAVADKYSKKYDMRSGQTIRVPMTEYPSFWEDESRTIAATIKARGALCFAMKDGLDYYLNYDGRIKVFRHNTQIPAAGSLIPMIYGWWKDANDFLEEQKKPKWEGRSPDAVAMYLCYKSQVGDEMEIEIPNDDLIDFGEECGPRMAVVFSNKKSA